MEVILHRNLSKIDTWVSVLSSFTPYTFSCCKLRKSQPHTHLYALVILQHAKKYLHMVCIKMLTKAEITLKDDEQHKSKNNRDLVLNDFFLFPFLNIH